MNVHLNRKHCTLDQMRLITSVAPGHGESKRLRYLEEDREAPAANALEAEDTTSVNNGQIITWEENLNHDDEPLLTGSINRQPLYEICRGCWSYLSKTNPAGDAGTSDLDCQRQCAEHYNALNLTTKKEAAGTSPRHSSSCHSSYDFKRPL